MIFADMPSPYGLKNNNPALVVVHAHGEFIDTPERDYYAPDWLDKLGLSAHVLITPSGIAIRCRNDFQGAYHAKGYNTDSLGIEWLVPGLHTWATFVEAIKTDWVSTQAFVTGVNVVQSWYSEHEIRRIKKHSTLSPGRKVDPGGGFPWQKFLEAVGVSDA